MQLYMFQERIRHYLVQYGHKHIDLKAVLFDMDGVLFDSMPYHAESWHKIMTAHGFEFDRKEAYLHEGRTGTSTIDLVCQQQRGYGTTPEEAKAIYAEKTEEFNKYPVPEQMPGALELLQKVKQNNLRPIVVTGSGQLSLLDRLNNNFPNIFQKELIVTAFDVKIGKPNPEPYLMGLKKGNIQANEAFVVENAPLGVQAGHAAGIFTIAVNTGPLDDRILLDAGADLLFPSMQALTDAWESLLQATQTTSLPE